MLTLLLASALLQSPRKVDLPPLNTTCRWSESDRRLICDTITGTYTDSGRPQLVQWYLVRIKRLTPNQCVEALYQSAHGPTRTRDGDVIDGFTALDRCRHDKRSGLAGRQWNVDSPKGCAEYLYRRVCRPGLDVHEKCEPGYTWASSDFLKTPRPVCVKDKVNSK